MDPMDVAFAEARAAAARAEVPVGAAVAGPDGAVIARAGNRTEETRDASAHAEMLALREAARALGSPRLTGCDLYVTLEPCPMCAAAISLFRVRKLVFGAYDPKGGGVEHGARVFAAASCLHRPEVVGGVRETEAADLLRGFFRARRPGSQHPVQAGGAGAVYDAAVSAARRNDPMSDNPLQDDPAREARIAKRAAHLWEEAGRPAGQEADFHERARELIAMEDHAQAALLPNPAIASPVPHDVVDEAELEENLGEFPSRLTDQGDRPQAPQAKHRR